MSSQSSVGDDILEVVACPNCHRELTFSASEDQYQCLVCNLAFIIREGIPVLLLEEALSIKV
jgi:uncharacterized protein YbaR (Trm112 family)